MTELHRITWLAGLFEGEGSFGFSHGKPKQLKIHMTDLDVLERVQEWFGGTISATTKQQEHWKDSWLWQIGGSAGLELAKQIRPYLLGRRQQRCDEFISLFRTQQEYNAERARRKQQHLTEALIYRAQGLTHQVIDRKSTRLNSSHVEISYAVFC